jgi:hypothetical protein
MLCTLLLTLSLSAQAPAPAADASVQAQVEAIYAEGAALYKAGKYRPAIEKFEEAFALYPEPNLLYNMGRAYEALGEIDQAMLKYRLCAQHPQSAPDVASKAREKLAVLEAAKATSAATTTSSASTPATTSTAPGAPAAAAPAESGGFPVLGTIGAVAAVGGIAAAVAGGVVFAGGAALHDQISAAKNNTDENGVASITRVNAEQLAADGTSQKTTGVILLSVGGGLVLLSLPFFVVELSE